MGTDSFLSIEDGEVFVGKVLLPGVFISMRVNAGVRFDKAERDHMSGKNKTPKGWEDADIQLSLDLLCDEAGTCYDKLKAINAMFKAADKGANPKVYQVTNHHMRSRGISKVVFSGLETNEDDMSDVIRATLTFSEHLPGVVKREKRVNAGKAATGAPAAAPATKAKPAASAAIVSDPSPIMAGFNAGVK
jgi:hypothetical protein